MILSTVHQGVFKYSKSDHGIVEEKPEICSDREMRGNILEDQGVVENNTDTRGTRHGRGLLGMH